MQPSLFCYISAKSWASQSSGHSGWVILMRKVSYWSTWAGQTSSSPFFSYYFGHVFPDLVENYRFRTVTRWPCTFHVADGREQMNSWPALGESRRKPTPVPPAEGKSKEKIVDILQLEIFLTFRRTIGPIVLYSICWKKKCSPSVLGRTSTSERLWKSTRLSKKNQFLRRGTSGCLNLLSTLSSRKSTRIQVTASSSPMKRSQCLGVVRKHQRQQHTASSSKVLCPLGRGTTYCSRRSWWFNVRVSQNLIWRILVWAG